MGKNWKDVQAEILEETHRIWFEEPDEIKMIVNGIYPSGAGVGDIVFGNHYNVTQMMQTMSYGTVEPTMYAMLSNPDFTLDQCKTVFQYMVCKITKLTGLVHPPRCPYPWLNLVKFKKFYEDIVEAFDTIETKEDFRDLIWVFCGCYCARLCFYLQYHLPWTSGAPRMDLAKLQESAELMDMKAVAK